MANGQSSLPAWAMVAPSGQSNWTWAASTEDQRALVKPDKPNDRLAAAWYNYSSFDINLNFTDGQIHGVNVYCLDFDLAQRIVKLEILDAATNAILDTRTINSFSDGVYLRWQVSGNAKLRVTDQGPSSASVSGVFIDGP